MDATTTSPEAQFLLRSNQGIAQEATREAQDPRHEAELRQLITQFVLPHAERAPFVQRQKTEEIEGSVGYLPAPAEVIQVEELMEGKDPPPMHVHDEERKIGEPQPTFPVATIDLIVPINPLSAAKQEHNAFSVLQMATATRLITGAETVWTDPEDPSRVLRTERTNLVVHFVHESAFGDRKLITTPVTDLPNLLTEYGKALTSVTTRDPTQHPELQEIAYRRINKELGEYMSNRSEGGTTLHVPLVVQNEPQRQWGRIEFMPTFPAVPLRRVKPQVPPPVERAGA